MNSIKNFTFQKDEIAVFKDHQSLKRKKSVNNISSISDKFQTIYRLVIELLIS